MHVTHVERRPAYFFTLTYMPMMKMPNLRPRGLLLSKMKMERQASHQRDSRFSRIFFSFSLLVLYLEPFQFHFHFPKKKWRNLIFHFSLLKKSESYLNFTPFFREKKVKSGARYNGIMYHKLTSHLFSWLYLYWTWVRSLSTLVDQVFEAEVW